MVSMYTSLGTTRRTPTDADAPPTETPWLWLSDAMNARVAAS
jgi:hypothetical protein